jgi:hypothetical protein
LQRFDMTQALKAPFPAFGGKAKVAGLVWSRLGDVANYIEPFCRSAAVLLARPHEPRVETINDLDCYVANFWRAVQRDPEAVALHADWPVNEADLHARHRWLVLSEAAAGWRDRMRADPDYFDAKIAGWWVWGACCWIGGGWCDVGHRSATTEPRPNFGPDGRGNGITRFADGRRPALSDDGEGVARRIKLQVPDLSGDCGAAGRGIHASAGPQNHALEPRMPELHTARGVAKRPRLSGWSGTGVQKVNGDNNRPQLTDQYARGRGVHGNDDAGTCADRREWLVDWMLRLADRLRVVRVCCGQWRRVCDSHSVTTRLGVTGLFLDPPYRTKLDDGSSNRNGEIYATDRAGDVDQVVDDVIAYCVERGADRQMRIAACSLEGEGYEVLEGHGWRCVAWRTAGGYGNRARGKNRNRDRERIWFSPYCLEPGNVRRQRELL